MFLRLCTHTKLVWSIQELNLKVAGANQDIENDRGTSNDPIVRVCPRKKIIMRLGL